METHAVSTAHTTLKANALAFAFLLLSLLLLAVLTVGRGVAETEGFADASAEFVRFVDGYLIDTLVLFLVFFWISRLGRWGRGVAYFAALFFFAATLIQVVAVYQTGTYVSHLALENLAHISLFVTPGSVAMVGAGAAAYLLFPLGVERLATKAPRIPGSPLAISLGSLVAIAALSQSAWWLPTVSARQDPRMGELARNSPPRELARTINETFLRRDAMKIQLTTDDVARAEALGFVIDIDARLPLVKDYFYRGELPFESPLGGLENPNVIVFFTEGLSARTVNAYGSTYPELTPNIDAFSARAIKVENYFNHAAATYRGLLGQVCSFFPWFDGSGFTEHPRKGLQGLPKYSCAPDALRPHGYESHFLFTQKDGVSQVDELMTHAGFDSVWTAESLITEFLPDAKPIRDDGLTDHQFVESLVGFLRKEESAADQRVERAPFFAALYNIETHAWQDTGSDGKPYGDGQNAILNTIHNFDHAFGEFWEFFSQSSLHDNTVVIVTADHAHYHEKAYVEIMDDDYVPLFVDKIPLLIRYPNQERTLTYDAQFASSIDFAPTLMHLIGIPNQRNAFVGESIFSERKRARREQSVASLGGGGAYLITPDGVRRADQRGSTDDGSTGGGSGEDGATEVAKKLIDYLRMIEREDRIWDAPIDRQASGVQGPE